MHLEDMGEHLEIVEHNVEALKGHNIQACLNANTLHDDHLMRLEAKVIDSLQAIQISIKTLQEDLAVCKKAATTEGASTSMVSPRVDCPKPNGFDGRRDTKEVENFLWQMERYFEGLNLTDEASRVITATLYLTILLFYGSCLFQTWEDFKKELKRHLYLENIFYEAHKKLQELKQQGTIREYVKNFTTIMLQIPNLSEEDLLFHFLHQRDVKLVDEAITVVESLTEYKPYTDEYEEKKRAFVPNKGCFMCKGLHAIRNYPKLGSLSAMVERNEVVATMDEGMSNIGSIRLLNALNAKSLPTTSSKGLMYMEAYLSGKSTRSLVDTGATHNFIIKEEANRLGLRWRKGEGWLKMVNAKAQPLNGVVKNVELRLGTWKGQVDFSVAPMDDFKVVLGMDFLRKVTAIPMPSFSSVYILKKGAPCMIPTIDPIEGYSLGTKAESRYLSAMQITKGVKGGEPTYLTTLKEKVPTVIKKGDLPPIIQNVLKENKDVMSNELPKKLPPRQGVDHKIKLEPGTKPPAIKANVVVDALSQKMELAAVSLAKGEITDLIKQGLDQDPLARELKKLAVEGKTKQFWVEDGLLYYTKGRCLYVPKWGSLRKELIKESLLEAAYFWPHMRDSVKLYVKTCLVCPQDKVENKQPTGLLEPLLIPDRPWEFITMDFINALPKSERFGFIIVVVDQFFKYGMFIPCNKDCTTEEAAKVFLKNVVKYWGLRRNTMSDRDPQFTERLWTELFKLLGLKLYFSTSFHPQTNGQTK
ncbi:hypothetical protein Pfo_011574 [Paulownia fortunei]|nr:hypothetical protein Pfo_011574 [Paulownia fortunei]